MTNTITQNKFAATSSDAIFFNTLGLDEKIQKSILEYYRQKLNNTQDEIHHDDMHRIAFHKTIEFGFLGLFLFDSHSDQFLFNEGYFYKEVHSLLKNYVHRLDENNRIETYPAYINERLYDIELRLIVYNSKRYIFGAIVQESQIQNETLNYLEKFFSRYYLRDEHNEAVLYEYNCIPQLNNILQNTAEKAAREHLSLHYILIQIEPLKKYIKVAGDFLVNEIIKNVQELIGSLIKDHGQCYILNSRQYLITATNIDEALIKEKFGHAHFRVKNLLLIYQVKYFEITDFKQGYSIENAWPQLMIK